MRCGEAPVCRRSESSRTRQSGAKSEERKWGNWVEIVRIGVLARGRQTRGRLVAMRQDCIVVVDDSRRLDLSILMIFE